MYQPAIRGLDFCSSNGQLSSLFRFFPEQPESESLLESTWCLYHDELWLQYNFHCTHGSELLNIDCVCIINFNFAKKKKKKKKEGGGTFPWFLWFCVLQCGTAILCRGNCSKGAGVQLHPLKRQIWKEKILKTRRKNRQKQNRKNWPQYSLQMGQTWLVFPLFPIFLKTTTHTKKSGYAPGTLAPWQLSLQQWNSVSWYWLCVCKIGLYFRKAKESLQ